MNIGELQQEILWYAKTEYFHVSLNDFLQNNPHVNSDEAAIALKELKKQRIVSMGPNIFDDCIGVTNHGWKVMGWR